MSECRAEFGLKPDHVPHPPEACAYCNRTHHLDLLRWVVMVADVDSNEFKWACRLIPVANERTLSEKQSIICVDILGKTIDKWIDGGLDCQDVTIERVKNFKEMIELLTTGGDQ